MARRAGMNFMRMDEIKAGVDRARSHTRDAYARLSGARIRVLDALGPIEKRYGITAPLETGASNFDLTPNSVRQLAGIAGMPLTFLESLPPAIGVATLRSCLSIALETRDDPPFLLRIRESGTPTLRAILPASFVRFDDREVLDQVAAFAEQRNLSVPDFEISDTSLTLRLMLPDKVALGGKRARDDALIGVDVRNSEVGRHALEVRRCVFRLVCTNGMTSVSETYTQFRKRKLAVDKDRFRELFAAGLDEAVTWGRESADRLGRSQSDFVLEPVTEVKRIFREYKLGNPLSEAARMVASDAMRTAGLLGVTRFELVQSFTKVAQALDREQRVRLEDAMGEYLFRVGEEERN